MTNFYLPYNRLCTLACVVLSVFMLGCEDKVEMTRTYTVYEPVYVSPDELRASFSITAPVVMKEPGKMFLYGDYLFVNEPGEGIHVINNKDKRNPINERFITLPGNFDIAIKDDALYADSYMDLVVMDIKDLNNITITSRTENIFTNINEYLYYNPQQGIVKEWIQRERIEVTEGEFGGTYPGYFQYGQFYATEDFNGMQQAFSSTPTSSVSPAGVGGSMGRFTIADNHLYTIDNVNLYTFDIQDPASPNQRSTDMVGWGIETIFPSGQNLFLGSNNGVYIYSIETPQAPQMLSMFMHVQSCDPVIVHDTLAYVTLRGGTECNGFVNQLDIINIKNPSVPELVTSYAMNSPYGLGYDNGLLFVCEGRSGLKVFDAKDPYGLSNNLLEHRTDFDAFDVIPDKGVLIMIGQDGLFQFDYSDPTNLRLLSSLPIERIHPID